MPKEIIFHFPSDQTLQTFQEYPELVELGKQISWAHQGLPTTATLQQRKDFLEGMNRAEKGDTDFTDG